MTPSEIFDKYIKENSPEKFKIYYLIKKDGQLNMAGMNFESNTESYCLNILSRIANQPEFHSWIFEKNELVDAIDKYNNK